MADSEAGQLPQTGVTWFGLPARRVICLAIALLMATSVLRYFAAEWARRHDQRPVYERELAVWNERTRKFIGGSVDEFLRKQGSPASVEAKPDGGRIMEYDTFLIGNDGRFAPFAFTVYVGPDKRVERVEPR